MLDLSAIHGVVRQSPISSSVRRHRSVRRDDCQLMKGMKRMPNSRGGDCSNNE